MNTLSGDGLLQSNADSINSDLKFIRNTQVQLGYLVEFRDLKALAASTSDIIANTLPTDPRHINALKLRPLLETKAELFDQTLKQYHEIRDNLKARATEESIVKVALEKGLTLLNLEDEKLHAQAFSMAVAGGNPKEFDRLNELREDAILDRVAALQAQFIILTMGASHRFTDNAEKRRELPAASRVSVIEYNPAAFPDDLRELKLLMER